MLFAKAGLSAAAISSLFIIWSVTSFALEIPSGVWADIFSRRSLLVIAPLVKGVGFALWTFAPSYLAFALGFVLWGAGGALRSGTLQALVYEELTRTGASDAYPRVIGRTHAMGMLAVPAATALAGPVLAVGGYSAVGVASVVACLCCAVVARTLPDSRGRAERGPAYRQVVRDGLAEIRRAPSVRRSLLIVSVLMGVAGALDEYVPLLARSTGAPASATPFFVLLVTAGMTAGGWLAGRGTRWTVPILMVAAGCLALGAASGRAAGMVLVALAFCAFEWATSNADARLQDQIGDESRATVTSVAGFGTDVVGVVIYAAYALGSTWAGPGPLFAVAAVPLLLVAAMPAGERPEPEQVAER
ncbi:MFS transporter [Actinoallomurus spadix]|uniref:MFS transporter n=1 Tax=Actinoallomurus spadix TaxID=79912 RepID=A0ABP3HKM8_9ACTN|nr:MFS transporter [Actinoallomurus spadix]MCO5990265.1 MFS transporter [Actinoallomurus spadix]